MSARRMRRELAAEIEAHIAERAEELIESGMCEPEARQQARREFGNPTLYAETGGEVWGWIWLERMAKDLRYAARSLRASPLFTATAVLSLALGIGANTAIFTLLYASLWKPLPVAAPQQIYQLWRHADAGSWTGDFGDSYDLFQQLSQTCAGVGALFAKSSFGSDKFAAEGVSNERVAGEAVSANMFSVLGVHPFLGRVLEPEDDSRLGGRHVAILSYNFWQQRFQANPSVLGKTIFYNEVPYTVAGVAQPGFKGIEAEASIDLWVPITASVEKGFLTDPNINWLRVAMRLHPDVPPSRAQALIDKTFRVYRADKLLPDADPHWRPVLEAQQITMRPAPGGLATTGHKYEKSLLLLMVLVALVLLIASANVANLILARNSARQHEIAIRRALGASRWRIAAQLFSESLMLAAAGAAGGLAIGTWGTRLLISFLPTPDVPLAFDLSPGFAVLGFTAAVALGTAILFGIAPAWRAGRAGEDLTLRTAQRVTRTSFSGRMLVAAQLGLSLVLLVGAGFFILTLRNLKAADLGFRPDNVITFDLSFPKQTSEAHLRQVYPQMKERLDSQSGVIVASYAWPSVYGRGGWSGGGIQVEGHRTAPGEDDEAGLIAAGPGFFNAIGLGLLQGRYLNSQDQTDKPPVALVNESFARYYFGADSPLGRHIKLRQFPDVQRQIVGVVRDARHYGVREPVMRMIYLPASRIQGSSFFVRTRAGANSLAGAIRADAAAIDKTAQVENIRPLETAVDDMISQERLTATLSAAFGALAVLLAAVGLYGVVAYSVSRRTNEFGIRMALGAQRGEVERLVLRQTIGLVTAGVALGLTTAALLVRLFSTVIAGMLYGVSPRNALIFAGAAILLGAVALLAAFLPARRASRIDPMMALRYE
jgi:predicted permease